MKIRYLIYSMLFIATSTQAALIYTIEQPLFSGDTLEIREGHLQFDDNGSGLLSDFSLSVFSTYSGVIYDYSLIDVLHSDLDYPSDPDWSVTGQILLAQNFYQCGNTVTCSLDATDLFFSPSSVNLFTHELIDDEVIAKHDVFTTVTLVPEPVILSLFMIGLVSMRVSSLKLRGTKSPIISL